MGPQDAPDRIWLKQSVQFSLAGQVRTIEIALPVRPGASAEEIERLLRQADAGLDQMTHHLNSRVRALLAQESTPVSAEAASVPRRSAARLPGGAAPASAVEGGGARSMAGDGLPATAGPALDRKQFIAEIAVLGLNPRQAMERLGIRTLDGVNLRQALEQLRLQLIHERPAPSDGPAAPAGEAPLRGAMPGQSGVPPRRASPDGKHPSLLAQAAPVEHLMLRSLPEQALTEENEQPSGNGAALERSEQRRLRERAPTPIPIRGERGLGAFQERARAQALLERLRRLRGRLNPPSADNLKAFRYVVEEQIGVEKTAALLRAVWNVAAPEQLSPDQVAECIRWGKDDQFEDEVDMLLRLTAAEDM